MRKKGNSCWTNGGSGAHRTLCPPPFITVRSAQPSACRGVSRTSLQVRPSSSSQRHRDTKAPAKYTPTCEKPAWKYLCFGGHGPRRPLAGLSPEDLDTAPWLLARSTGFLGFPLEMGAFGRQFAHSKTPTALIRQSTGPDLPNAIDRHLGSPRTSCHSQALTSNVPQRRQV